MAALTDAEIRDALPIEARQKIDSAFEALSQSLPTDKERMILYRVAHTLKLNPTDTHFSVMAALHYYLQLYQMIPDKIARAGGIAITDHINTLKAKADLVISESEGALIEMVRKAIGNTVAAEVSNAAMRIAADKVAAERNRYFWLATTTTIVCALVFVGTGYAIRMTADAIIVSNAKERAEIAITAAEQKARDEIEVERKNSGWAGTAEGRLAKRFFDSGAGVIAAKCDSPVWEVIDVNDGKYCIPKRRDLFGSDVNIYGWKIP